jgi:hypothetical protein
MWLVAIQQALEIIYTAILKLLVLTSTAVDHHHLSG